ncbi:hypothetical protein Bca52824_059055 [Brassica carinata]|uniref:Uncharacterized protein n=1 Tax=Brassica carinata TaxID=52824 RepID=A0A8X7QTP4_BRACI|nr:hypothetical protein Bca52824_059055 [Brassica carinata]
MGHDYSYSQPSESEDYGGNSVDSGYSETEDLVRRDQAEISYNARARVQYPPQPEVEFGFPQTCYCGAQPLLATSNSRNDPWRRYYTLHLLPPPSQLAPPPPSRPAPFPTSVQSPTTLPPCTLHRNTGTVALYAGTVDFYAFTVELNAFTVTLFTGTVAL